MKYRVIQKDNKFFPQYFGATVLWKYRFRWKTFKVFNETWDGSKYSIGDIYFKKQDDAEKFILEYIEKQKPKQKPTPKVVYEIEK